MHEGHRQRMIERLASSQEGLQEHELLEILLFNAIPRKNTNELAHRLLTAFGSIERVFSASVEELAGIAGVGANTAAYLKVIALCYRQTTVKRDGALNVLNAECFNEYLRHRFAGVMHEELLVYALDKNFNVKDTRCFTTDEKNRVEFMPEKVSKFIAKNDPYALVIAHNHVNASKRPSATDDSFTKQVQLICSINNVRLYDHMILGNDGFYSYFLSGRLDEVRDKFSVQALIKE